MKPDSHLRPLPCPAAAPAPAPRTPSRFPCVPKYLRNRKPECKEEEFRSDLRLYHHHDDPLHDHQIHLGQHLEQYDHDDLRGQEHHLRLRPKRCRGQCGLSVWKKLASVGNFISTIGSNLLYHQCFRREALTYVVNWISRVRYVDWGLLHSCNNLRYINRSEPTPEMTGRGGNQDILKRCCVKWRSLRYDDKCYGYNDVAFVALL